MYKNKNSIMINLKNLLNEASKQDSRIESRINYLVQLGFNKNDIGTVVANGVYYIMLSTLTLTSDQVIHIMKGFDKRDVLGYFPKIWKSGLSIKTNIKA